MELEAIVAHVRRRILETPIRLDPFPHIEVSDLVPDGHYRQLVANLPTPEQCYVVDEGRNFGFAPALSQAGDLWRPFGNEVARAIMTAALDKFASRMDTYLTHLRQRWLVQPGWSTDRIRGCVNTHTSAQVFRRTKGYSSDPHFHQINETVACLFYLPSDESHAHLGTDLYRVTKSFRASWSDPPVSIAAASSSRTSRALCPTMH